MDELAALAGAELVALRLPNSLDALDEIARTAAVLGADGVLVGIVTNRDMRFASDDRTPVRVMMSRDNLAILREPADRDEAISLMKARRIEKLLITNAAGKLTGLLTLKDTEQSVLNPLACKDELGRLRVAAASTVGDEGFERSSALIEAGVDLVVIDTAHGHSEGVALAVSRLKTAFPDAEICAGNVATAAAARAACTAAAARRTAHRRAARECCDARGGACGATTQCCTCGSQFTEIVRSCV